MTQATTVRGGKFRVLLETDTPGTYAAPCGFTSRSLTLNKALEEVQIPDCDDPDQVDWLGRDATSLSMSVSGEGVLAYESVATWLEAWEERDSINVKVEIEFPLKTYIYTGAMHVESLEMSGENGRRVTMNVSLQSDGEMIRSQES